MDYTLQFDPKHRVLLITLGKVVTEASASAAYAAVERFIAAEGPCSGIADLSAVERADVHGYFVRSLASRPRAIPAGMPLILVAPGIVVYGLSRMYQLLRDETEGYRIVHTREEAFALLSVEPRDFMAVSTDCLVAAH
jgi:hypothetical protein